MSIFNVLGVAVICNLGSWITSANLPGKNNLDALREETGEDGFAVVTTKPAVPPAAKAKKSSRRKAA